MQAPRGGGDVAPPCQAAPAAYVYVQPVSLAVPDNNAQGVVSTLSATDTGAIASLSVSVDIAHTYRGDLRVWLVHGTTQVLLHDRTGSYENDLIKTYDVPTFIGQPLAGPWALRVSDQARGDVGTLHQWSITATTAP